jgi:hypothetical protein
VDGASNFYRLRVSRGQRNGSSRPHSRFSRQEPLTLTSPTSGVRSVCIVRSRIKSLSFFVCFTDGASVWQASRRDIKPAGVNMQAKQKKREEMENLEGKETKKENEAHCPLRRQELHRKHNPPTILFSCGNVLTEPLLSVLYRPSDRRLSVKLVPNFANRVCRVVSVTNPHGRILVFPDRSRYFPFQAAPQLYSRGWVDPVPDPLLLRKSGIAGNRTQTSASVARNSDHQTTEAVPCIIHTGVSFQWVKVAEAWSSQFTQFIQFSD